MKTEKNEDKPGEKLTAWLRTVVPGLWSALVAWGIGKLGLPPWLAELLGQHLAGLGEALLFPLTLGAVYGALRWAEKWLPSWLTKVLLGSTKTPSYPAKPAQAA